MTSLVERMAAPANNFLDHIADLQERVGRLERYPDAGGDGSAAALADESYLVLGFSTDLSNERVLTVGNGLVDTDLGAGSTYTVALGAPSSVSVLSTNLVTGGTHYHAVITSAAGAVSTIMATDADGRTQVDGLGINVAAAADGQITMVNGGGIGVTGDVLVTWDIGNNYLEITGCNVGIGTTTPSTLLHVYKDTDAAMGIKTENPNAGADARAVVSVVADGCQGSFTALSTGYGDAHRQDRAELIAENTALGLDLIANAAAGTIKCYAGGHGTTELLAQIGIAAWTTSTWQRALELRNASVIKWVLGTSYAWGIGQSADNLYVTRSAADDSSAVASYAMYLPGATGRVGINSTTVNAQLHVLQSVADAAIPVLILDQDDVSEGCIDFVASARGAISGTTNSVESVRVELNGTVYRLALYADA